MISAISVWLMFKSRLVAIPARNNRTVNNYLITIYMTPTRPITIFQLTKMYGTVRDPTNFMMRRTTIVMIAVVYIVVVNISGIVHDVHVALSRRTVTIP